MIAWRALIPPFEFRTLIILILCFSNIMINCCLIYNKPAWLSWCWGEWKGHRTWVRIPGPPCYFTIFFLTWWGVCTGIKTIMDHQLATIRSKADQIQRPSHEGLPCILVNVQHWNLKVKRGPLDFGPRMAMDTPLFADQKAHFFLFFYILSFIYFI